MEDKELYEPNQTYNQNQAYGQSQAYNQGQPYPSQPARAVVYDTMPMKNNNAAIGGLIIGIFALVGFWIPIWDFILSIAGIICSAIGFSHKGKSSKLAIGGLATSIIAFLLSIFYTIIYIAVLTMI